MNLLELSPKYCLVMQILPLIKPQTWHNKEFQQKAIQFHGTFYGLKITIWYYIFELGSLLPTFKSLKTVKLPMHTDAQNFLNC